MAAIVGIDLGTTKSAVAVWRDGTPQIIKDPAITQDSNDPHITPSVIAWDRDNGRWEVGYAARALAAKDPRAAIYSIKRFIGRRYRDEVVQSNLEKVRILYEVVEAYRKGGIEVVVGDRHLTPQQVSAMVLRHLKAIAEEVLDDEVDRAVITVPAYFEAAQRQATREAGRIAGLDVQQVLNEPTAACLAFGYQKWAEERKIVAVYDLGGGTFDISILQLGGQRPFRVRATAGNTYLGGDDLDWTIVDWVLDRIGGAEETRLRRDVAALARLRQAAEKAKRALSTDQAAQVQVPGPLSPSSTVIDLDERLTRQELEERARPWIKETLEPCVQALADAKLDVGDVQEVLMVGGQTRMPAIRAAVRDFFGGIEPNTTVHPEQVVALGAAVRAAILEGQLQGFTLRDVVPLSLGVNSKGRMDTLIHRGMHVPVEKKKIYSTSEDYQPSVEIAVYQGEWPYVKDNTQIDSFILEGFGEARRGEPQIQVAFRVDEDGILHVSAEDLRNPETRGELTVISALGQSDEEIEAQIKEVEELQAEIEAQRQLADVQRDAEQVASLLHGLLTDEAETLPGDLVANIRAALAKPEPQDLEGGQARLAELQELWRRATGGM
jgi:molecular chaperone DnaK